VLALVAELALLAAAVLIGLALPAPLGVRIVAAVLLPVAVIVVWGLLIAPRAARRLAPRPRALVQAGLFALAVLALAVLGLLGWAVALAVLAAARLALGGAIGRI
jgi:hypothetical protein